LKLIKINYNKTILFFLLAVSFSSCASTGNENGRGANLIESQSILEIVEQSAEKIAKDLSNDSRVAIVTFESANNNLSDFIIEELTGALFDRNIEVADRQNLAFVYQELGFQMSGNVSDETSKSIGRFLYADKVITGHLFNMDGYYQLQINVIQVGETINTSSIQAIVQDDHVMRDIIMGLSNQQTSTNVAGYGRNEQARPRTAGAFLDRGIMFARRAEYEKAIADFSEAIKLHPDMSTAYRLRGMANIASVSIIYDVAYDFSVFNILSLDSRALVERPDIIDQAIIDFTQAIRLEPPNARLYLVRGIARSIRRDYDLALADFMQAIDMAPNSPDSAPAYFNRGNIYTNIMDYDRAIVEFNRAINLAPHDARYYFGRADAYQIKGDNNRAIADYTQAIKSYPDAPFVSDIYKARSFVYLNMDDYDNVILDSTEVIRLDPSDIIAYQNRAYAYANKENYNQAIADYSQIIKLNPNDAGTYYLRGLLYIARGEIFLAIDDLEAVLIFDPGHVNARKLLQRYR